MKLRLSVLGLATAALLALPLVAEAGSGTPRATGGGQILFSTDGGAGNTIAFNAHGGAVPKGQLQKIDRSAGNGQAQVRFHGVVDCYRQISANSAEFGGYNKSDLGDRWTVVVTDNGEGANAAGADMIAFEDTAMDACAEDDDDGDASLELGRGNVQVYDGS
jgi:hypothetical protein